MDNGFFTIGICNGTKATNMGTLWRSAYVYGAAGVFTVGHRYSPQSTDTVKTWRYVPMVHYVDVDDLVAHLPRSCPLVGVEISPQAQDVRDYIHPERACYILGSEDQGLTKRQLAQCHSVVQLPGEYSLNVAVAGSVLMHDRWMKQN